MSAAPIPTTTRGAVVEVVLADPTVARKEQDKRPARANGMGTLAERTPTLPVVRAWLSAHATAVTHTPARITQASGEVEDPRVPAWAEEMIPSLAADSIIDKFTVTLATHSESLIPLAKYFTMDRPAEVVAQVGPREGGAERGGSTSGSTGGMGGRGGMGVMGGRGGMGRRGGTGGSSPSRTQGDRAAPPLATRCSMRSRWCSDSTWRTRALSWHAVGPDRAIHAASIVAEAT